MEITLHQTHHKIADFQEIFSYLKKNLDSNSTGLHVFPELFLTGYPLQDVVIQKPFIDAYQSFLKKLEKWLKKTLSRPNLYLLFGGIDYTLSKSGIPVYIKNVVFTYSAESGVQAVYTKQLLPNYDIFDEKKYFTKGQQGTILSLGGKNIGVLICEDMWASAFHDRDPVQELYNLAQKQELDLVVNLSASPYMLGKHQKRLTRAKYISNLLKAPFIYVNKVGAEDEILFDGQSFVINGDEEILAAKKFTQDKQSLIIPTKSEYTPTAPGNKDLSWENLFDSKLNTKTKPAVLEKLSNQQCEEIIQALCFGFQDYAQKNGFSKFTIALSGGMDSALVLTLIRLSLKPGQSLEAIYMPSIHSSPLSHELSLQLCQKLGVPLKSLPIKFLHSATKNLFGQTYNDPFEGLTDENVQSRLRGVLLYTRSNQTNSMVVNTSNKSELAVGYSTQYGDSVGAISLLGDLFKSEVYRLAEFINEHYKELIPSGILTREPTAELREGQLDKDSLPPYEILDAILEGLLNYRYSKKDLEKLGFSTEDIDRTFKLYSRNEYKRFQFCPIIKVSSKSFGFGHRIPLSKSQEFYIN